MSNSFPPLQITLLSLIHTRLPLSFAIKLLIRLGLASPSSSNMVRMASSVSPTLFMSYPTDSLSHKVKLFVSVFPSLDMGRKVMYLFTEGWASLILSNIYLRSNEEPFITFSGCSSICRYSGYQTFISESWQCISNLFRIKHQANWQVIDGWLIDEGH